MSESAVNIPRHIGFILDGNRRWAKTNGLTSLEGHKAGYETLKKVTEAAFDRGVKYVSVYVFSTENWSRTKDEVSYLMDLALQVFKWDIKEVHKKGIRVRWLGTTERLSRKHINAIEKAVEKTKDNQKGQLCFCFNYGGQLEIVEAAKQLIQAGTPADEVTVEKFAENLYTPDVPEIDLMVRSSGEQRISNFMLWRMAYSEIMFLEKHWPDFTESDVDDIITEYNQRQRRYGA